MTKLVTLAPPSPTVDAIARSRSDIASRPRCFCGGHEQHRAAPHVRSRVPTKVSQAVAAAAFVPLCTLAAILLMAALTPALFVALALFAVGLAPLLFFFLTFLVTQEISLHADASKRGR